MLQIRVIATNHVKLSISGAGEAKDVMWRELRFLRFKDARRDIRGDACKDDAAQDRVNVYYACVVAVCIAFGA